METKPACKHQINTLDEKIERSNERIGKLEEQSIEWIKVSTILDAQTELNKKQSDALEKQSDTLEKVNQNLTTLNQSMQTLHGRVEDVEKDLRQQAQTNNTVNDVVKQVDRVVKRVDGIEKKIDEQTKSSSISVGEAFKKSAFVIIAIVVTALITSMKG